MPHQAFESAGRAPGIEKWLVHALDALKQTDPDVLAVFHTGAPLPNCNWNCTTRGRVLCKPPHLAIYSTPS